MSNTILFIGLAYFLVALILGIFIANSLSTRRELLKKLYYEGFLKP